jgi:hypothetical protein
MRAVDAAVLILEKEGSTQTFGLPGAAINPFYSAMKKHGGIKHVLARHVEGASHMAEGYTRALAGNIGVCIGTSGPAGTDMITGLYSASADSIPILCITGQAPVAKLHKEDFQAVDIASIAKPVAKWAVTVMEPAQVPGTFQKAFQLMRSDRPGPVLIDLPLDVQLAEIDFDIDTYEPLPVARPAATRAQAEKVLGMLGEAERPLIVAGGGVVNADAADLLVEFAELTGIPRRTDADGLGRNPGRPPPHGRHGRSADLSSLRQRDPAGVGPGVRHRQPLGQPAYRLGCDVHRRPEVHPRRHRADPDRAGVRAGLQHRLRRSPGSRDVRFGCAGMGRRRSIGRPLGLGGGVPGAPYDAAAQDALRQRADQAAAGVRGDESGVRA